MLHPSASAGDPGSFCVLIMAACSQQGDSSESESCVLSVLSMGTIGLHVVNSASTCHIGQELAIISTWQSFQPGVLLMEQNQPGLPVLNP